MKKTASSVFLAILLSVGFALPGMTQKHKADDILGTWLNQEGTGKVTLYKEKGKYFGKVVWLREPNDRTTGKPRTDKENPDPKLKSRPLIGLVNMRDFVFDGEDEWSDGTIYDPKNGKTYSCYIEFEGANRLKVRGYVGVSLIGRSTYWTKTTPP